MKMGPFKLFVVWGRGAEGNDSTFVAVSLPLKSLFKERTSASESSAMLTVRLSGANWHAISVSVTRSGISSGNPVTDIQRPSSTEISAQVRGGSPSALDCSSAAAGGSVVVFMSDDIITLLI